MPKISLPLSEIAEYIGATLIGDARTKIFSIATLPEASAGQISFLANKSYKKYLSTTHAAAVILQHNFGQDFNGNALLVDDPYLAYAKLTQLFAQNFLSKSSIHKSASIADDAVIGSNVSIGAHAVIESGARIEDNVVIKSGAIIGERSTVGSHSIIYSNVVVYHDVQIGSRVLLHGGVVIGADGFGFAPAKSSDSSEIRWQKIHQLAGVVIGDDVEVGANTCVDRGALTDTIIESGVKLDNMVQIAHGVKIGKNTVIAGCTAVAGSTTIGENCMIAGGVGIVNHITIADNVIITPMTLVTKSITKPGSYSSGTPMSSTAEWRKSAVRFGQLDSMSQRLKEIEKSS